MTGFTVGDFPLATTVNEEFYPAGYIYSSVKIDLAQGNWTDRILVRKLGFRFSAMLNLPAIVGRPPPLRLLDCRPVFPP